MKSLFVLLLLGAAPLWSQANYGEVHLRITDPSGAPISALVALRCSGNGFDKSFKSDGVSVTIVKQIPYGVYQLNVLQPGLAPYSKIIVVRSALPIDEVAQLRFASQVTEITVTGSSTLIDPYLPSSAMHIGAKEIQQRLSALPGRSVQDLVNSQPGWLYEGNAVLHPRGSEYQTQFVVDGMPQTDNRFPGSGQEVEADELDSVSIYTAGFPAEYGRKLGGVVELNTRRQTESGLHGQLVLSGGSYETASSYGQLQDVWGRNELGVGASRRTTSHYLNPVVPENFTNHGASEDFSVRYERDLTDKDRVSFIIRHESSRFLIPNELVQQQAGQIQKGANDETVGTANYQHIVSADSLIAIAGMMRDKSDDLSSNLNSTPMIVFQHSALREGYFKGTVSHHQGHQEFKTGVESDASFLHEHFSYSITDPLQFDPDTAPNFAFQAQRPDLEQSSFVEDLIRLDKWTIQAGLRWDHYQLLLNRNAVSPRISLGYYLPSLNASFHTSFDRIFQTPSSENILLSSSPQIEALSSQFLRLPVQPSRGNYYEAGLTESFAERVRLDVNVYRRDVRNYSDDDQLLNTGVSYPIAFRKAVIYGADGKLQILRLRKLSGFVSYSYMVGNAWFPVTGGLFLGADAGSALAQVAGHFPDSQDQRNTVRTRFTYSLSPRIWVAAGAAYGSGLPFQYQGAEAEALAEYGPEVVGRLNFVRGRVRPVLAVNSSVGFDLYRSEKVNIRLQVDGDNLNNRLNVIDFGGLFSGNAIGPAHSGFARLNASF
jgi:hypothetical protein